jgi:hypothetical protein
MTTSFVVSPTDTPHRPPRCTRMRTHYETRDLSPRIAPLGWAGARPSRPLQIADDSRRSGKTSYGDFSKIEEMQFRKAASSEKDCQSELSPIPDF